MKNLLLVLFFLQYEKNNDEKQKLVLLKHESIFRCR